MSLLLANNSGGSAEKLYSSDVFSTYLYTGNGSTQTINNGIDLAGKGGLVWLKSRSTSGNHGLYDSARGIGAGSRPLSSDQTNNPGALGATEEVYSFNGSGFSLGTNNYINANTAATTYVSWTFRKAPKFFDVVTWTGDGSVVDPGRSVTHNLGVAPGLIIVKCLDIAYDWQVYHASLGRTKYLALNLTDAQVTGGLWGTVEPTATDFKVMGNTVNRNGSTYVAYLFAHDPEV